MIIAGYSIGASVGYNYIHGEDFLKFIKKFEAALEEARAANLPGTNILGSGFDFLNCTLIMVMVHIFVVMKQHY